jgi:putative transposase
MARPHRIQMPGIIYHIFSRGNEKMRIFTNNLEREMFLKILKHTKNKFKFRLYAYVLMPNHYHLLLEQGVIPISKIMQVLNTKYSTRFNWKHNRVGHLFQGRYKSIVVEDSDYLIELVRYIHMNPMRKRLAECLDDYKWSSHQEYIGATKSMSVDTDKILKFFGDDKKGAVKEYRLFLGHAKRDIDKFMAAVNVDRLIMGGEEFTKGIIEKAAKKHLKLPLWALRGNRADPLKIIDETARKFEVGVEELVNKKGKWNFAKKAAIYLLWKNTSLPVVEISHILKMHYSGIKRSLASVEKGMLENEEFKLRIEAINYICTFSA